MPRWFTRNDNWDFGGKPDPSEDEARKPGSRKRRLALTFVFTLVFFAGASFAAVAGSKFSASIQDDSALEATSTSEEPADAASASDDAAAAGAPAAEESADAAAPASEAAPAEASAPADDAAAADSDAGTADSGFTQMSKASSSGQASAASSGAASASNGKKGSRASAKTSDTRSQWIQLRKVLLLSHAGHGAITHQESLGRIRSARP